MVKLVSWNVNGINALIKKEDFNFLKEYSADTYCLQELKATKEKMPAQLLGKEYYEYHAHATKKGYSGVSVYTKNKPLNVIEGLGKEEIDREARTITLEYEKYYLINCYFPNAQPELKRIEYKKAYNKTLEEYAEQLRKKKHVIITGDFNVAHKEIDLKNPKANKNNPGFSEEERTWIDKFLQQGWTDTFRLYNKEEGQYSWWSYRFKAREKNIGWRIDYFITNKELQEHITKAEILQHIYGSDHCPIMLEVKL